MLHADEVVVLKGVVPDTNHCHVALRSSSTSAGASDPGLLKASPLALGRRDLVRTVRVAPAMLMAEKNEDLASVGRPNWVGRPNLLTPGRAGRCPVLGRGRG